MGLPYVRLRVASWSDCIDWLPRFDVLNCIDFFIVLWPINCGRQVVMLSCPSSRNLVLAAGVH